MINRIDTDESISDCKTILDTKQDSEVILRQFRIQKIYQRAFTTDNDLWLYLWTTFKEVEDVAFD